MCVVNLMSLLISCYGPCYFFIGNLVFDMFSGRGGGGWGEIGR